MVVLGSSRIRLIGELGVVPARSEEGYMVWQIDTGLVYSLTKSTWSSNFLLQLDGAIGDVRQVAFAKVKGPLNNQPNQKLDGTPT